MFTYIALVLAIDDDEKSTGSLKKFYSHFFDSQTSITCSTDVWRIEEKNIHHMVQLLFSTAFVKSTVEECVLFTKFFFLQKIIIYVIFYSAIKKYLITNYGRQLILRVATFINMNKK